MLTGVKLSIAMTLLGKLVSSTKVHKEFYIKAETAKIVTLSVMLNAGYIVYFLGTRLKVLAGITDYLFIYLSPF